jgi:hypothetical protein
MAVSARDKKLKELQKKVLALKTRRAKEARKLKAFEAKINALEKKKVPKVKAEPKAVRKAEPKAVRKAVRKANTTAMCIVVLQT